MDVETLEHRCKYRISLIKIANGEICSIDNISNGGDAWLANRRSQLARQIVESITFLDDNIEQCPQSIQLLYEETMKNLD